MYGREEGAADPATEMITVYISYEKDGLHTKEQWISY